jgi:DNA-binding beta-propeller fold protein YncE
MDRGMGTRLGVIAIALTCLVVLGYSQAAAPGRAAHTTPLKLERSIQLPGISGDFDHFAVDLKGERLFLVGEDHKSVEVLHLKTGESLHSIKGFGTPHSVLYEPGSDKLYVTDGRDGTVKILRGNNYEVSETIKLVEGADSIGYDRSAQRLFIVTGGKDVPLNHSFLTAVDLSSRKKTGEIRLESNHVEAMALEQAGPRLFINITDKNQVAVIDRRSMQVTAHWTVGVAQENSPIALDEANRRLLVVCRKPGMLVVMNADTGAVVTSLPAAGRADDVAFDRESHRIYVPGGEGYISVFQQLDADHYTLIGKVNSAPGAKTALLVPELHQLFVAVSPGETNAVAKVLTYDTRP